MPSLGGKRLLRVFSAQKLECEKKVEKTGGGRGRKRNQSGDTLATQASEFKFLAAV